MIRRAIACATVILAASAVIPVYVSGAEPPPCEFEDRVKCFGVESAEATLSTAEAGAHPDLTFSFAIKEDPESKANSKGLKDAYAPTRSVRIELPPGLIGDPSVLGLPQQCTAAELGLEECPNGSQIGVTEVTTHGEGTFLEPVYMMQPPGGDAVARIGFVAVIVPLVADATIRSESDYGLNLEITDSPMIARLLRARSTAWGVPGAAVHDTERCTPHEVFPDGCTKSTPRPPGIRPLPFTTNPTRCGVPLEARVGASSWAEPNRFDFTSAPFPEIFGCDKLPFGPGLTIEPTNQRAAAPTGLEVIERLPASKGSEVLEPSQVRDLRVVLPEGMYVNTSAGEGLEACSEEQVHFGERVAAKCPNASKLADFEAEIPALPRRLVGAIYQRQPEPHNLFRVWIVADDLGAHVKLQGQLVVDEETGQIETVVEDIPQAPLREAKFFIKSGLRAPLMTPEECGSFNAEYEFTPWAGGPPVVSQAPMTIDEGCEGLGGFSPKLNAGSTNPTGGAHSPFVFILNREDGEQNPAALNVMLPTGLSATIAGIPRCEGAQAEIGQCPAASRIGKVIASAGAGPKPLWVPQPGKRPTAVYLAGPYKGAPLSAISVVPAEAGPFDLGDQVVRSAIFLDPVTAQGTVKSDPLPQILEGVPIRYRTVQVLLDRENFTLNPTSCAHKTIDATITSTKGAVANPSSPFTATNCSKLGFEPHLSLRLFGGTHRGAFPALRAVLQPGGSAENANIKSAVVRLPHSEFIEQAHFVTICTRVQYAAKECPAGSVYGHVTAFSPLLDEPLEGPVYLRSNPERKLPDVVMALHGIVDVEAVGHVDSIHGGLRTTFESTPDAPITKVVLAMQGGSKGLFVNSKNLCKFPGRALAQFKAQNGRSSILRPVMRTSCRKSR